MFGILAVERAPRDPRHKSPNNLARFLKGIDVQELTPEGRVQHQKRLREAYGPNGQAESDKLEALMEGLP